MMSKELISNCQAILLERKQELINRVGQIQKSFYRQETTGDDVDFGNQINEENTNIGMQNMLRSELLNIEVALHKIESGAFGTCEETGEPIEEQRLLLMPWTRHSIEGAEILEANKKKYSQI